MDLRSLRYFVTVVEEGNISKAARKLHVSQPPLSCAIKSLEEELQAVLFIRGSRHIELTEAGQLLYQHALSILELENRSLREIQNLSHGLSGTLSIGCVSSNHSFLVEKVIQPLHQKYPNIHYEIHEGNTYQLLDLLDKNVIEVAIIRTPFANDKIQAVTFHKQPMLAIYRQDVFSLPKECTFADLQDKPIILYRRFQDMIHRFMEKKKCTLQFFAHVDDARTALLWADAGLSIALVPAYALHYYHSSLLSSSILLHPELETQIAYATKKGSYLSPLAKTLLETLNQFK